MSKDLQFRACEEIDRRACQRDQVVMPPLRGGYSLPPCLGWQSRFAQTA